MQLPYLSVVSNIDHHVSEFIFTLHTPVLDTFFFFITYAGDKKVIASLLFLISAWLYFKKRSHDMVIVLVTVLGSIITTAILKHLFERPRPSLALYYLDSLSFPSGHTTSAMALYGVVIYLALKYLPKTNYRHFFVVATTLMIVLVGCSRLYLGFHYLSDVLAAYTVALLWLFGTIYVSKKFRRQN